MTDFVLARRALFTGVAVTTAGLALRPGPACAASPPRRPPGTDPIRPFSNEKRYGPGEGALRAMRESFHLVSRYASFEVLKT